MLVLIASPKFNLAIDLFHEYTTINIPINISTYFEFHVIWHRLSNAGNHLRPYQASSEINIKHWIRPYCKRLCLRSDRLKSQKCPRARGWNFKSFTSEYLRWSHTQLFKIKNFHNLFVIIQTKKYICGTNHSLHTRRNF